MKLFVAARQAGLVDYNDDPRTTLADIQKLLLLDCLKTPGSGIRILLEIKNTLRKLGGSHHQETGRYASVRLH